MARDTKLVEPEIVRRAVVDSFVKLNPRTLMRNPVMFVVGVGSVLTTILFFKDLGSSTSNQNVFTGLVALFLWFTVLFANFAEAIAEGRGKAQADTLRKTRSETVAHRRAPDGTIEDVPSTALDLDDECVVAAGEWIPSDGEVIEGIASVDESAITGESAPVIRESGGDRSAVTGGTRVLSDEIVVRITARPGETFIDRMIALVEGSSRQKTPNEIALNILLAGPHHHLPARHRHAAALRDVLRRRAAGGDPRRVARVPDPDHHRRAPVRDRHRGHGPPRAPQRARHEWSRGRGRGGLRDPAAGQDRHHHVREPPGRRVRACQRGHRAGAGRRRAALEPRRRDAGGPVDRGAREGEVRHPRARAGRGHAGRVHRADPDERRRLRRPSRAQGRRRLRAAVGRGTGRRIPGAARGRRRLDLGAGGHPPRRGRSGRVRRPQASSPEGSPSRRVRSASST